MMLLLGHDALSEFRLRPLNDAMRSLPASTVLGARWFCLGRLQSARHSKRAPGRFSADRKAGDPAIDPASANSCTRFPPGCPRLGPVPWSSKTTTCCAPGHVDRPYERGNSDLDGNGPAAVDAASSCCIP